MNDGPINFYFLSSGFCGTRFYHHALRLARNAEVWHQPGHEEISEVTDLMEQRFAAGREGFLRTELAEFPGVRRRMDKRLALPWIYGDTLNWMRGLGLMLYRYAGAERLRLVALVRHPVATVRSMLAHFRTDAPVAFSDVALAEELARRWVRQYAMIAYQFETIDNPAVCTMIRLEDVSLAQMRDLYHFLGLEGFDAAAIGALLENRHKEVRHSHLDESAIVASQEELRAAWRICAPLAAVYGYAEDERLYATAPSRPLPPPRPANSHTPSSPHPVILSSSDPPTTRPPLVKLFEQQAVGLIVRCPSGIHYINQAGGPICFWLSAEGAFIPLEGAGDDTLRRNLFEHFHRSREKTFMRDLRPQDADFIDAALAEHGLGFITVYRAGMGKTWDLFAWQTWDWDDLCASPWEAWVPVRVAAPPYDKLAGVLSGIDVADAILVWENSN
ncbi:MAG: sulfotransferase [Caldilinea sp.]|nr:sulfotransferase [Caldilinea sp.]